VILLRTLVLIATLIISQVPTQRVRSQAAAVAIPVGAAIVVIGGLAYYVWLNTEGIEIKMPVEGGSYLEDAEESDQWGEFRARDERHCQRLAGGRSWYWNGSKCFIKG
jgi:hypothetical protein